MLWEIIAVAATIIIFWLSSQKLHRHYCGYFVIGLLYGLWWEFSAEYLFNYTGFSIYLWKDIPLAIILLWGVVIAGLAEFSDIAQKKFKIFKNKLKNCLVWDIILATSFGWAMEISGSQFFGMWSYPATGIGSAIFGVPLRWLAGWIFVGVFVLTFARKYGPLVKI